jgi:hypothetical protein
MGKLFFVLSSTSRVEASQAFSNAIFCVLTRSSEENNPFDSNGAAAQTKLIIPPLESIMNEVISEAPLASGTELSAPPTTYY